MRRVTKQLLTANNLNKIIQPQSLKAPLSTLIASKVERAPNLSRSPVGVFGAMAQKRNFGDKPTINWSKELFFVPDKNDVSFMGAGYLSEVTLVAKDSQSRVTYFAVRWDGDKIRGLKIMFANDENGYTAGRFDNTDGDITPYHFEEGEYLKTFVIRNSGYGGDLIYDPQGHGGKPEKVLFGVRSIRQIEFTTNLTSEKKQKFLAGPGGSDNEEIANNVDGCAFAGLKVGVWDAQHASDMWLNGVRVGVYQNPAPSPSPSM